MTDTDTLSRSSSAAAGLESGRRTLLAEADALAVLAGGLGEGFTRALDLLSQVRGRVIVTGMGKSGHIARKIAATMASTGTPAHFVHPAEASHGDLGMITGDDAILALSNSGNTAELSDVIQYSKRFGIPLAAMTSGGASALALAADAAMILPDVGEACPMGLTPTTSTTLMMALGDALAVALLERNNFSAADFRRFHPGGPLGKRLLRVADLMHKDEAVPLTRPDENLGDAILTMTAKSLGCVGVVDGSGRLVGIVTDGDLRRHMQPGLTERTVAEVMTPSPRTIGAGGLAAEALHLLNTHNITSLFVVDEAGVPVGILHIHDCLRAGLV